MHYFPRFVYFLSGLFLLLSVSTKAQDTLLLQGIVVDSVLNEPLVGANIVIVDSLTGTFTDWHGKFALRAPISNDIQISYIGYRSITLSVKALARLDTVRLKPAPEIIEWLTLHRSRLNYGDQNGGVTHVLQQKDLVVADAINIAQAFDGLPGVQVQQGALNTQRLSLRGVGARTPFATNQVRLYWNDIPLTNGAGESFLEDIESGLLSTASVQTGPGAIQLGAHLGGSIQIVSKELRQPNWHISAGVSAGDFGRNRQWLNVHNKKGNWQQDLTLARSASDGYRDNNSYDRLSGTLLGRIDGNQQAETFYFAHWRSLQAEIPSSLDAEDFKENPSAAAFTWATVNGREDQQTILLGLQHSRTIAQLGGRYQGLRNRSSIYFGRQTNDEVRPFNILDETATYGGVRTTFLANLGNHKVQLGGEFFVESYDQQLFQTLEQGIRGISFGSSAENRWHYFLFTNWTYNLGNNWKFDAGLNMRSMRFQPNRLPLDLTAITFGPTVLPNVQLLYNPSQAWRFTAQINRGIAPPDASTSIDNLPFELDPLEPSTGWNRELTVDYRRPNFRIKATLFQMDITDAIVQREDAATGAPFFVNAGDADHQGLEISLRQNWPLNNQMGLLITSNYTFADYRFGNYLENGTNFEGNHIPGQPQHRWLSHVEWRWRKLKTRLSFDLASDQWVDDANTTQAEGYELLHLHAQYQLNTDYPIRIFAGIRNLFDRHYASMVQINARGFGGNLPRHFYPGLPRYWYVGVNVGLQR